jgi:hypothetical protein
MLECDSRREDAVYNGQRFSRADNLHRMKEKWSKEHKLRRIIPILFERN